MFAEKYASDWYLMKSLFSQTADLLHLTKSSDLEDWCDIFCTVSDVQKDLLGEISENIQSGVYCTLGSIRTDLENVTGMDINEHAGKVFQVAVQAASGRLNDDSSMEVFFQHIATAYIDVCFAYIPVE